MAKQDKETLAQDKEQEKAGVNKNENRKGSPLYIFFMNSLKDLFYAEHALLDALQKLEDASSNEELKDAFEDHRLQTKKHVSRLEKVFGHLDEIPEKKKCAAMDGLIKEAEEIINSTEEGSSTRDAALIIAAQKAEHYEIASYGGMVQLAISMGWEKIADLLEKTLEEEEETDLNLTDIAEAYINLEAETEV